MENWEEVKNELYFPLPFNDEQKQVNEMLVKNNKVIIDGYFGSGKSQALANLICNLIVHGKSVIITAKNESSLKSLLDKIPQSIRCSYNSNSSNLSKTEAYELYRSICNLKEQLNYSRIKQREVQNQLNNIESLKKVKIKYEGKIYPIENIEFWIKKNKINYSWFVDDIGLKERCPLSDDEFIELIHFLSNIDKDHFEILKLKGNIIDMLPYYNDLFKGIKKLNKVKYDETKAFIEHVKNILIVADFFSVHNALQDYLNDSCSGNLYKLKCKYNTIEKLKRERIYYKEVILYASRLKGTCPLLVDNILKINEYNLFKDNKINEAFRYKQWVKIITVLNETCKVQYNNYEDKLKSEKIREMYICREIVKKQLQYNKYIDSINENTSQQVLIVPLKKLNRDLNNVNNGDILIIEDAKTTDVINLDISSKFKKVLSTENSKVYEKDIKDELDFQIGTSKITFKNQYRCNPNHNICIKVHNGMKDRNKNINIVEADEIVKQINICMRDKRYDKMSFGVISLGHINQALIIQDKLIKSLGKNVIKERNLICGDINSFEGYERDVIFMSMVVADNEKFYCARKISDRIKYSIAATRAKYEMWIFYSFDECKINKQCMRYNLLKRCNNYRA